MKKRESFQTQNRQTCTTGKDQRVFLYRRLYRGCVGSYCWRLSVEPFAYKLSISPHLSQPPPRYFINKQKLTEREKLYTEIDPRAYVYSYAQHDAVRFDRILVSKPPSLSFPPPLLIVASSMNDRPLVSFSQSSVNPVGSIWNVFQSKPRALSPSDPPS